MACPLAESRSAQPGRAGLGHGVRVAESCDPVVSSRNAHPASRSAAGPRLVTEAQVPLLNRLLAGPVTTDYPLAPG